MLAELNRRCMMCGTAYPSDVHEIVRKSQAPRAWGVVENYLLLCRDCHDMIHRHNIVIARQLAIKLLRDPDHFGLEAINEIKPGCPTAMREVVQQLLFLVG